jgi:hypothetical protein
MLQVLNELDGLIDLGAGKGPGRMSHALLEFGDALPEVYGIPGVSPGKKSLA